MISILISMCIALDIVIMHAYVTGLTTTNYLIYVLIYIYMCDIYVHVMHINTYSRYEIYSMNKRHFTYY